MADFSIALNSVRDTRTVNIEGLGVLTARKLGSGEELQISADYRRMGKILDELKGMDFKKFDTSKPEHLKIVKRMAKRADEIGDELEAIKLREFNTYKNLLSDDQGGKLVDIIMNTLTEKERSELFKRIFGEIVPLDTPENTDSANKEVENV